MIPFDLILPVAAFGLSGVFTPGPNNIMLTASGVNFGFRRTVPHILGIAVGFAVMNLGVGLGLSGVFERYPEIHTGLKYVAVAYLLFLAYKIATAAEVKGGEGTTRGRPLTFLQAAAFQWVNPKAWAIALGAIATFTTVGGNLTAEVVTIAVVFFLVTFPSATSWTFFGAVLSRYLSNARRLRIFNTAMAGVLVLSLIPVLG